MARNSMTLCSFAALRDDLEGWRYEQDERAAWDATLGDDLEDD